MKLWGGGNDALDQEIQRLAKMERMETALRADPLTLTIPGVGISRALMIIALLRSIAHEAIKGA